MSTRTTGGPSPANRTTASSTRRTNAAGAPPSSTFVEATPTLTDVFRTSRADEKFAYEMPDVNKIRRQTSQEIQDEIKDAASRVLQDPRAPLEAKQRKLFLLESLTRAAPPPSVAMPDAIARNRHLSNASQTWEERLGRKSIGAALNISKGSGYVKKKKGVAYDPLLTALGIVGSTTGHYCLEDILSNPDGLAALRFRNKAQLSKDYFLQLKRMHEAELAHNDTLDSKEGAFVSVDGVRGVLADTGDIKSCSFSTDQSLYFPRDVFGLGVVMFRLMGCSPGEKLSKLIAFERQGAFDKIHDDYVLVQEADTECRDALARKKVMGSFLELTAQCCGGDRGSRPRAEDAHEWLDSMMLDLQVVNNGENGNNDGEEPWSLLKKLDLKIKADVKLPDLSRGVPIQPSAAEAELMSSDASSVNSFTSDDSYLPPTDIPMAAATKPRPSSINLTEFLKTNAGALSATATVTSSPPRRRSLDDISKKSLQQQENKPLRKVKLDDKAFRQQWKAAAATPSKTTSLTATEICALFEQQQRLPTEETLALIQRAENLMKKEPNLLKLYPPVVILGDIHGQFFDLINIMKKTNFDGKDKRGTKFLFLGDFVDRGNYSCEVLFYLLALKCDFPDRVFLLRGNHESRAVSSYFGFKDECVAKYSTLVFNKTVSVFQAMPLAAVLETDAGRFFCCHGGISPSFTSVAQLNEFNRFVEPGMNGFLCDLLWSDPMADPQAEHEEEEEGEDDDDDNGRNGRGRSRTFADAGDDGGGNEEPVLSLRDFLNVEYLPNPARGCSFRFGYKAISTFLAVNALTAMIRAHEVQMNGYKYHWQTVSTGSNKTFSPTVITVFSAPNYCGRYGNRGAVLKIHDKPPSGVSVRPSAKTKGAPLFRALELIEPIQFSRVHEPERIVGDDAQVELESRLIHSCPYLPSTFEGLYSLVKQLQSQNSKVQVVKERAHSKIDTIHEDEVTGGGVEKRKSTHSILPPDALFAVHTASESAPPARAPQSRFAKLLLGGMGKSNTNNTTTAASRGGSRNSLSSTHSSTGSRKMNPVESFKQEKMSDAKLEMNPTLMVEKMMIAREKIASEMDTAPSILDGAARMQNKTKSQANLLAAAAAAPTASSSSPQRQHNPGKTSFVALSSKAFELGKEDDDLEMSGGDPSDAIVSFSEVEVLGVRTLFLLIDRFDKGKFTVEDLVAWSGAEGQFRNEAQYCLSALDNDSDGAVGFDDWLVFSATAKDHWLAQEYTKVKTLR